VDVVTVIADERVRGMRGRVWTHIQEALRGGPIHMTLLDPASSTGKHGESIAMEAARLGTHAIMVGGSTGVTGENLDDLVKSIKERTHLPTIYFPSSAGVMSRHLDAVYFLSTLNSRNPRYIVGEQARGAPLLAKIAVECIGLGYIIVDPGMRVGSVSDADVITRDAVGEERAVGLALAAQMFGMPLVYLEAGSGAPSPVPANIIRAVKRALSIPLIVGGGIRSAADASAVLDAGADIVVTGTIAENGHFDNLAAVLGEVHRRRAKHA